MLCKARGDKFVEGLVKAHQRCAFNQVLLLLNRKHAMQ
jgi:hypothetical protein